MLRRATGAVRKNRFRWQCQDVKSGTSHGSNYSGSRLPFSASAFDLVSEFPLRRNGSYRPHNDHRLSEVHGQFPSSRYISIDASPSTPAGAKSLQPTPKHVEKSRSHKQRTLRPYQKKVRTFLQQVKANRVKPGLVMQKVEELLLLSLSEYDNNVPSDGHLALDLLNTALRCSKDLSTDGNGGERLLPRLFSLSCQMMIRSGHNSAVNDVHHQLWRLLDGHKHYFVANDTLYNTHHVNDVCSYFVRSVVMEANKHKRKLAFRKAQQLHRLIERLGELHDDPSVPIESSAYIDDSLIMLLCNQLKPRDAHGILSRRVNASSPLLVSSFVTVINGYARTFQSEKALSVIEWMMSFQNESICGSTSKASTATVTDVVVPPPNTSCFNALLHAYALTGGRDAGFNAEKTIEWMEELSATKHFDVKPNETTYNICINAWARSKHPEAPVRAESLLRRIVAFSEAGNPIEPSEEGFTAVMNTWVNSCNAHGKNGKQIKEATERVTAILDLMEHISEKNQRISMTAIPYTVLIKAWEKAAQHCQGSEKHLCGEEILKVVERMQAMEITPTPEVYNSVLTALAETAAINAVLYFLELEQEYCRGHIQLDTRTFNCGLNAIAALNRPDAVSRATDVLKRMFEYHEADPSILPSNLTFNIILKVLSRSTSHLPDAAAKADELLSEMDAMPSVTPDFISYVTCIIAWGRSNEKGKMQRVSNLLNRFVASMKSNQDGANIRSGIAVFNAVLSVCHHNSSPENPDESLREALATMKKLRDTKGIAPDQITYASFFQVVKDATAGVDGSEPSVLTLVNQEFNRCAKDGYITRNIIMALQSFAPKALFATLVGENADPRTVSIPKAWCRNTSQ